MPNINTLTLFFICLIFNNIGYTQIDIPINLSNQLTKQIENYRKNNCDINLIDFSTIRVENGTIMDSISNFDKIVWYLLMEYHYTLNIVEQNTNLDNCNKVQFLSNQLDSIVFSEENESKKITSSRLLFKKMKELNGNFEIICNNIIYPPPPPLPPPLPPPPPIDPVIITPPIDQNQQDCDNIQITTREDFDSIYIDIKINKCQFDIRAHQHGLPPGAITGLEEYYYLIQNYLYEKIIKPYEISSQHTYIKIFGKTDGTQIRTGGINGRINGQCVTTRDFQVTIRQQEYYYILNNQQERSSFNFNIICTINNNRELGLIRAFTAATYFSNLSNQRIILISKHFEERDVAEYRGVDISIHMAK